MAGFAPDGPSVRLTLDPDEAGLMARLLGELRAVIEADSDRDPVVGRLFPRAYEDDHDQIAFDDLVGEQLRAEKLDAIKRIESVVVGPGPVETTVPNEEVAGWLPVLTDLRLAIGTRLDVDEAAMDRTIEPDDPSAAPMSILHWLGWMQESLLEALRQGKETR